MCVCPNRHNAPREALERVQGIHLVEHVGVLVERRAVAALDRICHQDGPAGQGGRYVRCSSVSVAAVQRALSRAATLNPSASSRPLADLVVVAADRGDRCESPEPRDHAVRIGAVADQVPEQQDVVRAVALGVGKDALESVDIGVNVAEHQVPHDGFLGPQPLDDLVRQVANRCPAAVQADVSLGVCQTAYLVQTARVAAGWWPAGDCHRAAGAQ